MLQFLIFFCKQKAIQNMLSIKEIQNKRIIVPKPITLTNLVKLLCESYGVNKRPIRYFDVPKRGFLSDKEIKVVRDRLKELIIREVCVKSDPKNPICYQRVQSDVKAKEKNTSSYKKDYDEIYVPNSIPNLQDDASELQKLFKQEFKVNIPLGLSKISIQTELDPLILKAVYDRAVGAYATSGSRTGMSAEQWGYGRVYAFIMCYFHNKNGKYNHNRFLKNKTDYDLYTKL